MARSTPAFAKRFREATANESQTATALRLGVSQAYVSSMKMGTGKPSREIVERIAEAYGGREEWLDAAGYLYTQTPLERLAAGVEALEQRYGVPFQLHFASSTLRTLTHADVDQILALHDQELAAETGKGPAA